MITILKNCNPHTKYMKTNSSMNKIKVHGRKESKHYEENFNECRVKDCSNNIMDIWKNSFCQEHQPITKYSDGNA